MLRSCTLATSEPKDIASSKGAVNAKMHALRFCLFCLYICISIYIYIYTYIYIYIYMYVCECNVYISIIYVFQVCFNYKQV